MNAQNKRLFIKTATWLMAEVILNLVGLDCLADYSEFVFDQHSDPTMSQPAVVATLMVEQGVVPSVFA